ncbi:hypothetical protein [Megalodesulfovibrio gigas]|nr:hypothetical protein [Megalodesulfovibrio gigas]
MPWLPPIDIPCRTPFTRVRMLPMVMGMVFLMNLCHDHPNVMPL